MPAVEICTVILNRKISEMAYDMIIKAPQIAKAAKPGQFLNIKCGHSRTLRRPISVCDITDDLVRIVFEIRGSGTDWLSAREPGDSLDVLGPLGNGFPMDIEATDPILLIGGGIGVPPLLYVAKNMKICHAVLGFRTAKAAILENDFIETCGNVSITTDDGTLGAHGTVAKPMELLINKNNYSAIFACGPKPMLRAAADIAAKNNIPCFLSMEERMACGIGACLGCACKTKGSSGEKYSHVCKDGPVFDAKNIVWDDNKSAASAPNPEGGCN